MSVVQEKRVYTVPTMRRIGENEDTAKLYKLEDQRGKAIRLAAEELRNVLSAYELPDDYWRDILPESLLSLLESQDRRASLIAALAFVDYMRDTHPSIHAEIVETFTAQTNAPR